MAPCPKDLQGRSLRQFVLQTRLFRYTCSYLIYSDAFDAPPGMLKERIYHRLWDALTGRDSPETGTIDPPKETFSRSRRFLSFGRS